MKYNVLGIIIFINMLLFLNMSAIAEPVKLNKMIESGLMTHSIEYECDLNGNGRKDKIQLLFKTIKGDPAINVVINNKQLLYLSGWDDEIGFADINRKDNKIDIIVYQLLSREDIYSVYQYTGTRLVKTAIWKVCNYKRKKLSTFFKKNNKYVGRFLRANGDGTVTFRFTLSTNKKRSLNSIFVDAVFKVTKNGVYIDKKKTVGSQRTYSNKAGSSWYLYKRRSLKNNRLLCKLGKGTKYTLLKVQFTNKYIKMYIKVRKTKQKGWVIFDTKKLGIIAS